MRFSRRSLRPALLRDDRPTIGDGSIGRRRGRDVPDCPGERGRRPFALAQARAAVDVGSLQPPSVDDHIVGTSDLAGAVDADVDHVVVVAGILHAEHLVEAGDPETLRRWDPEPFGDVVDPAVGRSIREALWSACSAGSRAWRRSPARCRPPLTRRSPSTTTTGSTPQAAIGRIDGGHLGIGGAVGGEV